MPPYSAFDVEACNHLDNAALGRDVQKLEQL